MLPLEQQVCSLEYARKLKELCVNKNGIYSWVNSEKKGIQLTSTAMVELNNKRPEYLQLFNEHYSAFTTAELGEMLPAIIYEKFELEQIKCSDTWKLFYGNYEDAMYFIKNDASEANCRAKMLIHLIENKIIDVETINNE